jgi:hypothetical protein
MTLNVGKIKLTDWSTSLQVSWSQIVFDCCWERVHLATVNEELVNEDVNQFEDASLDQTCKLFT